MLKSIFFIFIISNLYPSDLTTIIKSDSIYIGSTAILKIIYNDKDRNAIPIFTKAFKENINYSIKLKKLSKYSAEYDLQFWNIGSVVIDSIKVQVKKNNFINDYYTNIIKVNVKNKIIDKYDLLPIKKNKNINLVNIYQIYLYGFTFFIGIFMLLYFYKKYYYNNKEEMIVEYIDPYKNILSEINKLEHPQSNDSVLLEKYYFKMSFLFRKYLKDKHFIKSTEMTSNEIIGYFGSINLNNNILNQMKEIIEISDKFKYSNQKKVEADYLEDKESFISLIKSLEKLKN